MRVKFYTRTTEFWVEWQYLHSVWFNPVTKQMFPTPETFCRVRVRMEDGSRPVVGEGKAELHWMDAGKFCKETGRKLSLARALKAAGFNKEERTTAWEAYRSRK